ncbi:hypothetical protein AAC387_Pa02g4424 [Persea americana]
MENTPHTRKRRRSSSEQPLQRIFTRSRFELFIHRTRSGRGRADPDRRRKFPVEIRWSPSSPRIPIEAQGPGNDCCNDNCLSSVKDLRTRRVFSPASVDGECSPEKKPKFQTDPDECEQRIDDGVDGLGEELMQTTSSESDGKSFESGDVKRGVGFGGEGCYKEQIIENGMKAVSGGVDGLDCKSSEPGDGRREMESDGEDSYDEQKINNVIEEICGGVDGLSEMTQTPSPDSNCGASKLSNVNREVGFDREAFLGDEKIDTGIEAIAIPCSINCSGEEWIQRTPPDGDIFCKSDVQEGGGNDREIHKIDVDISAENPSTIRIPEDNPSFNEGFDQSRKDATDTTIKSSQGLVPCSRLKLFQTPNSLSYRRLLPFLMGLAKDNASSLEIHPCRSLYPAKIKKTVEEKPHPPLLDSRSHLTDSGNGKTDTLCRQNQVDDLETPITETSVENRLDSLDEVQKETSLDGLSSTLTENQREKSNDVLETPLKQESKEKSIDALGTSPTEKLKEMSSGIHCLDGFATPTAYKSVEMCHAVSSSDPSTAECQIVESVEECMTETLTQNAPGNSITLHDPAMLMLPNLCTGTVLENSNQLQEYQKSQMGNTPHSRKRRRSSSKLPLQGIFTHTRLGPFIHRTQSSLSNCKHSFSAGTEIRKPPSSERIPFEGQRPGNNSFNDSSLISIRDLRTRRVLSPSLADGDCSPEKKPKFQTDPDECGWHELGCDGKMFYKEQKIDDEVNGLGKELLQTMLSVSDGKSSEHANARREMEFDGEDSYNEQNINSVIEEISGWVTGLDEMIQTTPPNSDCGSSKLINVQGEVGFDGEAFLGDKKTDRGIEAIPCGVNGTREEWFQTTLPDGDIFSKSDVQEGGGNDRLIHKIDVAGAAENPSFDEGFDQSRKDAADTMIKNRQGLVPCSRLKLYQTPNSLSYRRLLPFLMDLAKDNASSLEIHPCKSLYPAKLKKMVEKSTHPQLLDSRSHLADSGSGKADILCGQNQVETTITETSVDNRLDSLGSPPFEVPKESSLDGLSSIRTENQREKSTDVVETPLKRKSSIDDLGISPTEKSKEMSSRTHCLDGFETTPASKSVEMCQAVSSSDASTAECQIIESLEERFTETPIQDATGSSITLLDPAIQMLPDLCNGTIMQLDQVMPETSCALDLCLDSIGYVIKTSLPDESLYTTPTCNEALSMECANNIQGPSDLPTKAEEKPVSALSTDAKPLESLNLQSQSEYSIHLETPVLPPVKGILKTHPQECRGPCMCPDCASFRLHAEKANEFSRKQMQDAEGVAVGLMKELSSLRSVMEKMITSGPGNVRDQAIVQPSQIEGFCRRASRAEELARDCLRNMTRDLNNHCRITTLQRPKVRFADYLEEKLLLKLQKEEGG